MVFFSNFFFFKLQIRTIHQKPRADIGFDVSKMVISTSATKNVENHRKIWRCRIAGIAKRRFIQTVKQLAKALRVDQGTISRRLHAIGKIQNEGKWVLYELKERDDERRKTAYEILFDRFKRKSFSHRIVTGDKKCIYFDNLKRKKW